MNMATRIPAGKYRARARAWAFGMTSTKKPQIGVSFDVAADPACTLTWYGLLHDEQFAKRTMASMRSCGWDGQGAITEAQGLDANEVEVVVEDDDYNGEISSRIAWVNGVGPAVKALDAKQKDDLNAKIAQWQKKSPATAPKPQPKHAPPPAAAAPTEEYEIPF